MEVLKNKKMWIVVVPMVFAAVSYFAGFDVGAEVQSIVCPSAPVEVAQ